MISVCLATYNGGDMLRIQLESIITQLSDEDEVVVAEDGDVDAVRTLIARLPFANIKVIEGAHRGNAIYNFEKSILHSSGEIIFLADQDDKWLPGKVSCMVDALADADCVCSDCIVTDGEFNVTSPSFYSVVGMKPGKYFNLFTRNCYLGCCMAFRRRVLDKALPFPKNLPMHDIWIGNVSAFFYRMKFIDDKLILFRRHGNNSSSTASRSPYSLFAKLSFRFQMVKDLLIACTR